MDQVLFILGGVCSDDRPCEFSEERSALVVCVRNLLLLLVMYTCVAMGMDKGYSFSPNIILHCRLYSSTVVLLVKTNVVNIAFVSSLYE